MKWIEAKVAFEHADNDLAADLICNIFYDLGLQGVAVDDPGIEPEEPWAEDAIGKPGQHAVTGYIPDDSRTEAALQNIAEKAASVKASAGHRLPNQLSGIRRAGLGARLESLFLAPENRHTDGGKTDVAGLPGSRR